MSSELTVAIVGLGQTGSGLAAAAAQAGLRVIEVDADRVEEAAPADLVIEAVAEDSDAKRDLLVRIDKVVGEGAVLATTATAVGVTGLALATSDPGRVIGLQPSLPAGAPGLLEVVQTRLATQDAVQAGVRFAEAIGSAVAVVGDRPGQIVARLLMGYLNHAVTMFEAKYATRDDIDAAMRYGCGYPSGPLAMLDEIGLDTAYAVLDELHRQTGERVHAPAPIIKQLIAAGRLGRKSGHGFYRYEAPGSAQVVADGEAVAATAATGRSVRTVGVVGSGTMATGIMEVFARSGFDVVFVARGDEKVAKVRAAITKSLQRMVDRGRMTESERDEVLGRLVGATDVAGLAEADLVVEAIVEDLPTKLDLFARLDSVCKPGAVLATTTSSLPVVEMAAATTRPGDVIGLHFFNPATVMKLVEIVVPMTTAADVVATAHDVCRATGKVAVECGDRAGFIVNALLFPYLNDAVRMLESGYASMDEIDAAIKAATRFPMGPFALLDVVGNDVSLAIQRTLHREFRDPGFAPARTLEDLVAAGYQGRKTGRGFRSY